MSLTEGNKNIFMFSSALNSSNAWGLQLPLALQPVFSPMAGQLGQRNAVANACCSTWGGHAKQGSVDNIEQVITAYYLVELCTRNIKKIDRNS